MPSAPASISWRTSSRMAWISAGLALRLPRPTTCSRTVAAPMNEATLGETPFFSRNARYSDSVVQVMSYLMSSCSPVSRFFMASFRGPIDEPSPKTSVVTPCRISLWERPSAMRDSVDQDSMLMKPGATARPRASITVRARAFPSGPTAVILSPTMPTSALRGAPPSPS